MTDPIADFLTRIRNAVMAGKEEVRMPHSAILEGIARVLEREGFLARVEPKGRGPRRVLVVRIGQVNGRPVIENLRRISRPGRRVYRAAKDLRVVKSGLGVSVLSTPDGLMTNREAKKKNVGGEVLCEIW